MHCIVYRCARKSDAYLYVGKDSGLRDVPADLLRILGKLEEVLELELVDSRKLARANARDVRRHIEQHGYYLQLPPTGDHTPHADAI